jgi:hypothetical protein
MNVELVVAVMSPVVALVSTGVSLYGPSRVAHLEHSFEPQRQPLSSCRNVDLNARSRTDSRPSMVIGIPSTVSST